MRDWPLILRTFSKEQRWKRLVLVAFCGLIVFVAMDTFTGAFSGVSDFKDLARSTQGMPWAKVVEVMGEPTRTLTGEEYEAERGSISEVYSPEPPDIEADYVWRYGQMNLIVLIFFKDGTVVNVYIGET